MEKMKKKELNVNRFNDSCPIIKDNRFAKAKTGFMLKDRIPRAISGNTNSNFNV